MVTVAVALCRDSHAAEDLVQEAFASLHRQWERIRDYDDPAAWVRRVIANRSVSRWRRLAGEARALVRLGPPDVVDHLPADDRNVWLHVRRLPRRQSQVVALFYLDDLSVKQVAEVLGIDEPTVKTHLQRARRSLAKRLAIEDEH
jgi:RNA polymerase sigma-70 factor (ECF subfamily)